ncbi:hypothetical protein WICPIJ_001023 [Wickerhamomyces pijperi]|uniref:O-acyltransferase n=1 Tax=Wickerhamomyces pijperi TaxID=599730 RepID=A0A9P8TR09_WICPI|nr:hypothetical protein WICPIJ_001023 [Wickerhamomyces pijperi]
MSVLPAPTLTKSPSEQVHLNRITNKSSNQRASLAADDEYTVQSGGLINDTNEIATQLVLKNIKINKSRPRFKEGVPRSSFAPGKKECVDSILDRYTKTDDSPFMGVFVVFWVGVFSIVFNYVVHYYLDKGFKSELGELFFRDIFKIALNDLIMYLSIYFTFFVQILVKRGWIKWETTGWIVTSVYEVGYLVFFVDFIERQDYPWIGKIFLFLHSLVLLMKMHSYGFYNGYLWSIHNELKFSRGFQKKIELSQTEQTSDLAKTIEDSIAFCQFELDTQSTQTPFPSNISLANFFSYTMFPTLVYQIEYPRTDKIRWSYVAEKVMAIFGVIFLMFIVAQNSLYPLACEMIQLKDTPFSVSIRRFPILLMDFIPNFLLIFFLDFYLIWDAILNCLAELTMFGDREFYGPWWNCITWEDFSRLWNIPVHKFLLRHVYHSSISAFHLNKTQATLFTFLFSSVIHELTMYVLFGKFRGYIFFFQMFQLPLIYIAKLSFFKERKLLGNIQFWLGIMLGPALVASLYLTF